MTTNSFISTDRQAREAEIDIEELNKALSSEQVLRSLVEGLPQEVISGIRESLERERRERQNMLVAYQNAKQGNLSLLSNQAGNDLGASLIVARIARKLSQKDLARKLGLREQAIQRWESEKYRSISLASYQKVAQTLGVRWQRISTPSSSQNWEPLYDVKGEDLAKVLRHAREKGWLKTNRKTEESALELLVRYVGDHVARYGTPSLLRTGLNVVDHSEDWSLLSWKAQVTKRAEEIISIAKPKYRPINVSWLTKLVQLSSLEDGATHARDLLLENGIVLVIEPQIPGMRVDGAAFLAEDIPIIGMTLLHDSVDNFWFTLLHEIAHIILHYRTGLSAGFFDDISSQEIDDLEEEANNFAGNLLIPDEIWQRSPARIAKTPGPIEKLANQLNIHPAIVFGRIRMERNNYSIFSNKIGRGTIRKQLLTIS